MSDTQYSSFLSLNPDLQSKIWDYVALLTRDGPRVYYLDLISQSKYYIGDVSPNGETTRFQMHGPILAARPELRNDTKDQRALLMTCRASRKAFLKLNNRPIKFTRAHEANETGNYFDPRVQFTLYINAELDIICLAADQVRRVYQAIQQQASIEAWPYNMDRPETNWPLWFQINNIAIDITDPQVSLHSSRKAMELILFKAIGELLYHPTSVGQQLRLFMANFAPVQYDNGGQPADMTIDVDMPQYASSMIASYAGFQNGLSVDDMWVLLDEGNCVRNPDWAGQLFGHPIAYGRFPRLLVPSQDGQRLLCIRDVEEPDDDPDSEDGEDDGDDGGDGDVVMVI